MAPMVERSNPRGWRRARHAALALLATTLGALAAGGLLHLVGAGGAGDAAWTAAGAGGMAYAAWTMAASLRHGRLGVDVIALVALAGALAVGEVLAAAVVAVMLTTGRALEHWAEGRARRDLHALVEQTPRTAHRYRSGTLGTVDLAQVTRGDLLAVAAGEVVPVDGTVASPLATLDESALTGEPLPVERTRGEPVRSGVVNAGGVFDLRATATAEESTFAGVVRLVARAEASQAPFVRVADRVALWLLPLTAAAATAAWLAGGADRAVAVLVVATPCPLILAAPIALVAGLSRAARRGVVVKGGGALERLARCTTLLIDKTGTLTSGRAALADVVVAGDLAADEVLRLAGSLDQLSPHVLASAVVAAATEHGCELVLPEHVDEQPGKGIRGVVDGHDVSVGDASWAGVQGLPPWARLARRRARLDGSLTVFVSVDGTPAGVLVFDDPVRPDAARTVRLLRRSGMQRVVLVTGDRPEVAEAVGALVGVNEVLAECTPEDKLAAVRLERRRAPTAMVGDGINDAPALALADVGVSLSARGATASSEAADVVLTVDRIDRLGEAAVLARRSRSIALQSVVLGMSLSLAAMAAAGLGLLPAVWGALLQEGIDVAAIANALRALRPAALEARPSADDGAVLRRFQLEHRAIRTGLVRVRQAADALGTGDDAAAMDLVRDVHRLLVEVIAPHEAAEEETLYPVVGRVLRGRDPTGTMSRAHVEIARQVRHLTGLLDEVGDGPPDDLDVAELRRTLYGLYAVLALHTAQEDESYLSLAEDVPGTPTPRATVGS